MGMGQNWYPPFQPYSFTSRRHMNCRHVLLKLKLQYFGHLMQRADPLEKTLMLGRIERQEEEGTTEDEMVEWHHRLNGHEFE